MKIYVVDYGTGNVNSVVNMLTWIGIDSVIIQNPKDIIYADKVILPGIGSFDNGMQLLQDGNWIDVLNEFALIKQKYILGICLGMQLMCNFSEEGTKNGLGWIDANVLKFNESEGKIKIPHMGWNNLNIPINSSLFYKQDFDYRYYFVHSYYVELNNRDLITSYVDYGVNFTSSFQCDNIIGVQFHPEKSHKNGMNLFSDFSKL